MQAGGVIAVVSDGTSFWTEIYEGRSPQGTFARHVDAQRWPSMFEAKQHSPWWPAGEPGLAPSPDDERMHRAMCSWAGCPHKVVWVARLPEPEV